MLSPEARRVIRSIIDVLPPLLIPAACIVFGIRLIVGQKEPAEPKVPLYNEYTIPGQKNPAASNDIPAGGDGPLSE